MSADRVTRRGLRPASDPTVSRRRFLGGAAAFAGAAAGAAELLAAKGAQAAPASLAASPPPGLLPTAAPGRIVQGSKGGRPHPKGRLSQKGAAPTAPQPARTGC